MAGRIGGFDTSHGSTVALLGALVLALVVTLVWAVRRRLATAAPPAPGWVRTSGTVISATVQRNPVGTRRSETPLVLYAYQVDGQVFQGSRVKVRGLAEASGTLARYPAGACVTVFYDPADPANSALER